MSATFSINNGSVTETTRKISVLSTLEDLQDNTSKLISPRDVRDAIFTIWSDSAFKYTTTVNSSIKYIGIDSGNPSNRDIKQKILIGKRSNSGLDIMNSPLLSSNNAADIFLYNTKPDNVSQDITKVAILAGTNPSLHFNAPYLQSRINDNKIDMDIVNPSGGPINLTSNTGRVFINGIGFPTSIETATSSLDGKILRYSGNYPSGNLIWTEPTFTLTNIGNVDSPTEIFGNPVLINGNPIEFIDDTQMAVKVGDFATGSSFPEGSFNGQNWPVVEVVRNILYPYVAPILSISAVNNSTNTIYAEAGLNNTISISYSVSKTSHDISNFSISDIVLGGPSQITGAPYTSVSASVNTIKNISIGNAPTKENWTLTVIDSTNKTYTASASITFVNPIYYGFSNTLINNVSTLTKLISEQESEKLAISIIGSGYLYFIQPANYDQLIAIKQTDIQDTGSYSMIYTIGNTSNDTFTMSTNTFNGINYRVYRSINICEYNGPGKFEFIYQ
jgi:hypothetical protein